MMIKYGTGRACVTTGTYGTFRTCGTKWTTATFLLIFNVNSNSFYDSKYAEHFRKKIIHKEQLWNRAERICGTSRTYDTLGKCETKWTTATFLFIFRGQKILNRYDKEKIEAMGISPSSAKFQ